MSKFKKLVLPLFFLLASVCLLSFGLIQLDVLPTLNLSELISLPSFSFDVGNKEVFDNSYLLDDLKTEYLSSLSSKEGFDDNSVCIVFDLSKDIDYDGNTDSNSLKTAIYSDFDYLRNFVPDYIFLVPDNTGKFDSLLNSDGTKLDILSYCVTCTEYIGAEAVLVVNDELFVNQNGGMFFDAVSKMVKNNGFRKVLLSLEHGYFEQYFYDCTKFLHDKLSSEFSDVLFGVEFHSNYENSFSDDYAQQVMLEKLVDFGYVDIDRSSLSSDCTFASLAYFWNSFFEYYSVPCICEHRLDLIFTNDSEWGYSNEINLQIKELYNLPTFDGSCLNSLSSLNNKKALARDLAIFLNDVSDSVQKNLSLNSMTIIGNNVVFSGSASSDMPVFCNDEKVQLDDGLFAQSFQMSVGRNEFDFFSNGAAYSYPIFNVSSLFYSYNTLAQSYNSESGIITAFAICPENAVVYSVFEGKTYQMLQVTYEAYIPDGYAAYAVNIAVREKINSRSELSLFCGCSQSMQSVSCGTLEENNVKNSDELLSLSPFTDNGLGNSLMCMITWDNTEQISEKEDYDTYHPDTSSLLKGTVDYVEKIDSSGGYLRYELKSGLNVYGTDALIINNGYNLPLNKAVLKSIDDSSDSATKISLKLDWLAPVTVSQEELAYSVGYQSFSFNIEEYTASYVDVKLYYTESLSFDTELVFGASSVFSNYEIYQSSEGDMIVLRLYLRQQGQFYGYTLSQNDDGTVELSFKKYTGNSLAGKVVMLDAGHGGLSMIGTATADDTVGEARITLSIAMKTRKYLENLGAVVIMTRTADTSLSLSQRADLCEAYNPDIFVSIHCDGSDNPQESGTHTFYYRPYSQPLAKCIHNQLVKTYSTEIYLPQDDNYDNIDRKVKYYPFYVTRVDTCPSVLIETGFLTNFVEGNVLSNSVNQDKIALGIANGICDFFNNN